MPVREATRNFGQEAVRRFDWGGSAGPMAGEWEARTADALVKDERRASEAAHGVVRPHACDAKRTYWSGGPGLGGIIRVRARAVPQTWHTW